MSFSAIPAPQGLYDPRYEQDSCGVAAIADLRGRRSHRIVADGITALINLDHRGAAGADPAVGDGAGILVQIPEELFRAVCEFDLPKTPEGADGCAFAAGIAFLPRDAAERAAAKDLIAQIVAQEGLELLGWRTVPTVPVHAGVGQMALDVMPVFEQLFLAAEAGADGIRPAGLALDRLVFPARKQIEHRTAAESCEVYFPSLSSRTITYKGMLTTEQLPAFYPDLTDVRMERPRPGPR